MSSLDYLLSGSISNMIEKKLGKRTFQKIEKRLNERYGISVLEAIRDFQKMDATLREFFGPGADDMEKDFLNDFVSLDDSKRNNDSWIVIEDQKLCRLILESYGSTDKQMILETSLRQPNVILDILENCNLPKSSGYKVIKSLIKDGLMTSHGYSVTKDGKRVNKYTSLFKNTKIDIQGNKMSVKVQINEDFIKESYLMKVMQGV